MRTRRKLTRLALMLAVALVAAGAGMYAHEKRTLRFLELQSIDARFSLRGERDPSRRVAVVAIDDTTFSQLKLRWPFRRTLHAQIIDKLQADGARVIAYDVQFTEPSEDEDDDFALLDAVARAGNVVLGTSEIGEGGTTSILGGDENLRAARARPASALYDLDPNGVIRRIPYETQGLKTMPVVAYERGYGNVASRKDFEPDGMWIDYAGPPETIDTVSFSEVLREELPKGFFKGRIVVVGASAPSLHDVHPTSAAGTEEMPGPEIQANAIDTLIRGQPLRAATQTLDLLLIALLALAAPLTGIRLGASRALFAALASMALFLTVAQYLFNDGTIVGVAYPLAAAVLSTAGVVGVHYFTEVRERRRTRTAFARFVPAAVVDRVLEQAEDGLRLGGEEVLGTVLFSDIRGFTTFSESHPAVEVIEILNRYLTEMTDAIMGHGGTLIGYLGDGIIAIFGAPLEQDDHADRAVAAAQEMLGPRLEVVNRWLAERGIEPFGMGVGINSGLFMAGNVGSQERLEYTVIGDTVNTAARMEGLTKGSGHSLFLAESTRFMMIGEPPPLEYVGEFDIRGREAKMKVWAPTSPNGKPTASIRFQGRSGDVDIKHLEGVALFEGLSKDERAEVARQADEVDIEAGKRLVTAGRFGYEFFVIEDGRAEVVRDGEHVADLGPGDFFGEMAILGDTVRNADVVAKSDMTAMVMTDAAFKTLSRKMPHVAEQIREACRTRTEQMH